MELRMQEGDAIQSRKFLDNSINEETARYVQFSDSRKRLSNTSMVAKSGMVLHGIAFSKYLQLKNSECSWAIKTAVFATTVHFKIFIRIVTGCCSQQDLSLRQPHRFRMNPASSPFNEPAWTYNLHFTKYTINCICTIKTQMFIRF